MYRSFSYTLLITWIFLIAACNTNYTRIATNMSNMLVTDSLMPVDSQLVKLYLPYKEELDKSINRIISINSKEMMKGRPESNLTNFLADLLLYEGQKAMQRTGNNIPPDMSFFNYGGIRTSLPKGEITVGKIFELMPFENEMVILQLSGKQIQEFLDQIAARGGESIGGTRFVISGNKATDIQIGNKPIVPDKIYRIVTNDYIAAGGDGLEVMTQSNEIITTGIKIRDVIISHLENRHEKNEDIYQTLDGRISFASD